MVAEIIWFSFFFCGKYGFFFFLHFRHAEIQGVSKRPAMNLLLPSFRGPDDVAEAWLYLALRKRGRKKSTDTLSCFWGSFYFIFIPHVPLPGTYAVKWVLLLLLLKKKVNCQVEENRLFAALSFLENLPWHMWAVEVRRGGAWAVPSRQPESLQPFPST